MLFREFPQHNEGQKSKLKASLVSAASLARLGERLGLGEYLILGRGEEKTGGRRKQALLADGYEALIAAIYLDGGIEPARAFIERQFDELIAEARRPARTPTFTEDYKSALQEWLQSHDRGLPAYRLVGRSRSAAPADVRRRSARRRRRRWRAPTGGARKKRRRQRRSSRSTRSRRVDAERAAGSSRLGLHRAAGRTQSISMIPQFFSRAPAPPGRTRHDERRLRAGRRGST